MAVTVDSGSSVRRSCPKSSDDVLLDGGAFCRAGAGSTSSKDPSRSLSVRCKLCFGLLSGGSKKRSPGFDTGAEWKSPKSEEDEWWCPRELFAVGLREGS